MHHHIKKSRLFEQLPVSLSQFEAWLPAFRLADGPVTRVQVVLRPKMTVSADTLTEWQKNCQSLAAVWWRCVLIPAVQSLPESSRTCQFNAINTVERTQIFPVYLRLYEEDMSAIDQNLDAAPQELDDFS